MTLKDFFNRSGNGTCFEVVVRPRGCYVEGASAYIGGDGIPLDHFLRFNKNFCNTAKVIDYYNTGYGAMRVEVRFD